MSDLMKDAKMVFLEVTNYCNFSCCFCPQGISKRPPEHMDAEHARDLIIQLHEMGYQNDLYFHILGEPLLHPDIFGILELASKLMKRAMLFTNGSLLSRKNIESIFNAHPYELMVSMQLVDERSYRLRGSSISWERYVSGIRDAVQFKLTHNTPTLLRVSVGTRKEDAIYPQDDYFPRISPSNLRGGILQLFSGIPSLDSRHVQRILDSTEIPFEGRLEMAPGISLTIKPVGNWRRIYRRERVLKGYCPHVGKEFGVLSNGNVVLCHLDYDGKTTFDNSMDGKLRRMLQNGKIQQEIDQFQAKGIVPNGCQYCNVPYTCRERVEM